MSDDVSRLPSLAASSIEAARSFEELCLLLSDAACEQRSSLTRHAVEDQSARFRIWGGNLGAFQRASLKTSLDYRLREAQKVATQIQEHLDDLLDCLRVVFNIASGKQPNRNIGDDEDGDEDGDEEEEDDLDYSASSDVAESVVGIHTHSTEAEELFGTVKDTIAGLFRLSVIIRKYSPRDRFAKALSGPNPFNEAFDVAHTGHKFPKLAKTSCSWLQVRLGRAITQRRRFLQYTREHRQKLSSVTLVQRTVQTQIVVEPSVITTAVPTTSLAGQTVTSRPLSTLAPTSASTLMLPDFSLLDDIDHPDDRSQTSYAQSLGDQDSDAQIQIPALASVSHGFSTFECPFCWSIQTLNKESSWQKHVYTDLRPYVCTFEACDVKLYTQRRDWWEHEARHHRLRWKCHFCTHDEFRSLNRFHDHVRSSHVPNIDQDQLDALSEGSSRPLEAYFASECPFCDEWQQILEKANPEIDSRNIVVTAAQFRQHVGSHMQALALFALPRGEHGDQNSECSANTQAVGVGSASSAVKVVRPQQWADVQDTLQASHRQPIDVDRCAKIVQAAAVRNKASFEKAVTAILARLSTEEWEHFNTKLSLKAIFQPYHGDGRLFPVTEVTSRGRWGCDAFWLRRWAIAPYHTQNWWNIGIYLLLGKTRLHYKHLDHALGSESLGSHINDVFQTSQKYPRWLGACLSSLLTTGKAENVGPPTEFQLSETLKLLTAIFDNAERTNKNRERETVMRWLLTSSDDHIRAVVLAFERPERPRTLVNALNTLFCHSWTGLWDRDTTTLLHTGVKSIVRHIIDGVLGSPRRDALNLEAAVRAGAVSPTNPLPGDGAPLNDYHLMIFYIMHLHWNTQHAQAIMNTYEDIRGVSVLDLLNHVDDPALRDFCVTMWQSDVAFSLDDARDEIDAVSTLRDENRGDQVLEDELTRAINGMAGIELCSNLRVWKTEYSELRADCTIRLDFHSDVGDEISEWNHLRKMIDAKFLRHGITHASLNLQYMSKQELSDEPRTAAEIVPKVIDSTSIPTQEVPLSHMAAVDSAALLLAVNELESLESLIRDLSRNDITGESKAPLKMIQTVWKTLRSLQHIEPKSLQEVGAAVVQELDSAVNACSKTCTSFDRWYVERVLERIRRGELLQPLEFSIPNLPNLATTLEGYETVISLILRAAISIYNQNGSALRHITDKDFKAIASLHVEISVAMDWTKHRINEWRTRYETMKLPLFAERLAKMESRGIWLKQLTSMLEDHMRTHGAADGVLSESERDDARLRGSKFEGI
ncbi:hypothetical protein FB567DRAFT_516332 [Paraphoma chrysanthemicola]|uniref:Oxidoreductase acuF-like C2H2 type zinc-finger domain-containing protein n=1 Tax=Paraphoma chrysanthemicola TaxID=798071 RepID=A0A8K0RF30_9PLEO|nr:hypothetical protein FB567DRAFT_516332 [Paraphoma chrysanthemicola]